MSSNVTRLFVPLLLAAGIGSAQAQNVQWTRTTGSSLPANAVATGGSPNGVVCRLLVNGSLLPGEFVNGTCVSPTMNGSEMRNDQFDVLVGPSTLTWIPDAGRDPRPYPRGSAVPEGAVTGGRYQGQQAYVCRANGHAGRLVAGICTIFVDGQITNHATHEVLVNRSLRAAPQSGVGLAHGRDPQAARSQAPAGTPTTPTSTPMPPGTPTTPSSTPMPPGTPTTPSSTPMPPVTPAPPTSTPVAARTPVPPATPSQPTSSGR